MGCGQRPATNVSHEETAAPRPTTTLEWESGIVHDFGLYKERVTKDHRFVFRNTGDIPFVVDSVITFCGCTHADYSKQPVAPGDTGSIHMSFSGNGFSPGYFHQHARVYGNIKEPVTLELKGIFDHVKN